MPDIPAEAIKAAERAIEAAMTDSGFRVERSAAGLASVAVEAAAPILAEAVALKILAHMEARGPAAKGSWHARNAWRRHFRIAAQVAHFAFHTHADMARVVVEAIARGDVVTCTEPYETADGS
jgi:hypothetical protein